MAASLSDIRRATRAKVERALEQAESRRAKLDRELREVEQEIALAAAWLGRGRGAGHARTLQDAIALVLRENGNRGMKPAELADLISSRDLYRMRDGRSANAHGIQARVTNYREMFVRENGLIRLREGGE